MAIQCMALTVYIELDVVLRMRETSVCARVQLLVALFCIHHNRTTKDITVGDKGGIWQTEVPLVL